MHPPSRPRASSTSFLASSSVNPQLPLRARSPWGERATVTGGLNPSLAFAAAGRTITPGSQSLRRNGDVMIHRLLFGAALTGLLLPSVPARAELPPLIPRKVLFG